MDPQRPGPRRRDAAALLLTAYHVQQTNAQPLVPSTFKDMLSSAPRRSGDLAMQRLKSLLIRFWQIASRPGAYRASASLRWRLHLRRDVLRRLQHRARSHQHGKVLHFLSRNARQRVPRSCRTPRTSPTVRRPRPVPLPCAAHWTDEDRPQDAGLEGSLGQDWRRSTRGRSFRITGSSSPSMNGRG